MPVGIHIICSTVSGFVQFIPAEFLLLFKSPPLPKKGRSIMECYFAPIMNTIIPVHSVADPGMDPGVVRCIWTNHTDCTKNKA